ncbi:hypothetical protein [Oceanicola sp. 502str15]|uniref:hypothetical protein n=1 Tax=Oceanicola sp. 502str15 TaxID=2696061 RepID=UPI002094495B|nr:hypothetical protein [Oceanicola sp. 502str15]MCO6384160.1 hypothetical protein [Oceanicola sp. 502str15]
MKTALATTALLLASAPLAAQTADGPCGKRQFFVDQLVETYQEQPVAGGLQSEDSLVEIWASKETGSFTILVTDPGGETCVAFTGEDFHEATGFVGVKGEAS